MAVNIQQELERLYGASQAQGQSLSQRLEQMDQYAKEVNPVARSQILNFENRPAGYNPLQDIASAMEFSERSRDYRTSASQDLARNQAGSMDLLSQLAALAEQQRVADLEERKLKSSQVDDFTTKLKQKAAEKQISEGKLKLNPKTGELEYDDNAEGLSKEGQEALTLIDEIMARDTKKVTGVMGGIIPWLNNLPDGRTTNSKINQLKSKLSLEARQLIKGTGQISDNEQKMLRESVAALDPGMSDEDFRAELTKIKGIINGDYRTTSKTQPNQKSGGDKKTDDPLGIL